MFCKSLVNLNFFSDVDLGKKIIENCCRPHELVVRTDAILEGFSSLPLCEKLDCRECGDLRQLPDLPLCKTLNSAFCENLTQLPELPFCERINCDSCFMLSQLPEALPMCMNLSLRGCYGVVNIPKLPDGVSIEGSFERMTAVPSELFETIRDEEYILNVDLNRLSTCPQEVLHALGEMLLADDPFPSIVYYENGEPNMAIDVGGVTRDFISRLFEGLFKDKNSNDSSADFLAWDEDNYPVIRDQGDFPSYETIGRIMAACYADGSTLKIGNTFPASLYERITEIRDPSSVDDATLTLYLGLRGMGWLAPLLLSNTADRPNLTEIQQSFLIGLLEDQLEFEGSSEEIAALVDKGTIFEEPHFSSLTQKILKSAREDMRIFPLELIAKGLKEGIGENNWDSLISGGGAVLQERVEGILDKNLLLSQLDYESHVPGYAESTKGFVKNWIKNADEVQLRKFVRAVTGSNSLGKDQRVLMNIIVADKERRPVGRTCFFTLDIPRYPDQEAFNQKLAEFLDNASGFTIG